ncbi:MAG TPA: glycosyltransferase family 4 protein [Verrucomicrobiae bacterium]|nr:glycosyltransferase family 4 protein [Verrucomicrobiae bacterium]
MLSCITREMKLLFVHECFGAFAGAEVNVLLTAAELKQRGHQLAILHGRQTGKSESTWRETFAECFPLPKSKPAKTVSSTISQFQPDAIYVHKMADVPVIEALVRSGRPLVRMVHDHDLYCMRSYRYNPFTRKICTRAASLYCVFPCGASLARNRGGVLPFKWNGYHAKHKELALNRKFQRMIVATHFMREELVRNRFDPAKIEIHAPVPRSAENLEQSSFSPRNLILYTGQIIRGKGVDVLLEALAKVREPFECMIFGDGSARAQCEALCRELGLSDRVFFKGYVAQEELKKYFRDASLAVMSSVWPEPFGAAGLEAMRHGLPVVAFDAGGIREWLVDGHNGFLVPWMDRGAFAARAEELLRDKKLARRLGEQGRQFARERFDFAQYISGLEEMFARVIAECGGKEMISTEPACKA